MENKNGVPALIKGFRNLLGNGADDALIEIMKENENLKKSNKYLRGMNFNNQTIIDGQVKFAINELLERLETCAELPCRKNGYRAVIKMSDIYNIFNVFLESEMSIKEPESKIAITRKPLFNLEEGEKFISFVDEDIYKTISMLIFVKGLNAETTAEKVGYSKRQIERLRIGIMQNVIKKLIRKELEEKPVNNTVYLKGSKDEIMQAMEKYNRENNTNLDYGEFVGLLYMQLKKKEE